MKQKIILIIIYFFLFSPEVLARSLVNRMDISINVLDDGKALVTENWQLGEQNNNYFEKSFYNIKDVKITDITVRNQDGENYSYIDKFNKDKVLTYNYKENKEVKTIRFTTDNKEANLELKYYVDGIITKYDDVYALNWEIISATNKNEIGTLDVYITGPIQFNETNMALYCIGSKISCEFDNGAIHLFSSNVYENSKISLMASLADYKFTNFIPTKGTFQENYEEIKSQTPIRSYIKKVLNSLPFIIGAIVFTLSIIALFIYKLVKREKVIPCYKNIKPYKNKKVLPSMQEVNYVDDIPCNNDIYKIYFIASYYNIIKNKSCLIGTLIFKWILEGYLKIENDEEEYYLKIISNPDFKSALDQELFNIIISASSNQTLDNIKLTRYIKENPKVMVDWYDKVVKAVVNEEYKKESIKVKNKKIILTKKIYEEAQSILGYKKYLLNFNQVPRITALTEEIYKYSLISSILLRVDENLYEELLRKNPKNEGALVLKKFSKVKDIYKNIYTLSYEEYKKNKKLFKKIGR